MKKLPQESAKPASRGLRVFAFLGGSLFLAIGGVFAVASAGGEVPTRAAVVRDPLTEAKVAFVDGDLAGAEKILRTVAGNEARTLLGKVLLVRGRCDEASRLFGDILKEDPKNFEATRGMAVSSRRLGRLDLAALYWMRATEFRKDDAGAWRELGLCQRDKGDALAAMSSIQQSLNLDPNQTDLSNLLTELATVKHEPSPQLPVTPARMQGRDPVRPQVPDPRNLIAHPQLPDPLKRPQPFPGSLPR